MQFPVFILPLLLLPQGITRLRVFEPRYLRLVAMAMRAQQQFVLATPAAQGSAYYPRATLVEIINFDYDADKLLLIDIKAIALVELSDGQQQADGLWLAQAQRYSHWSEASLGRSRADYAKALERLLQHQPFYAALYPKLEYQQQAWVCARLLELLPLDNQERQLILADDSYPHCKALCDALLFHHQQ